MSNFKKRILQSGLLIVAAFMGLFACVGCEGNQKYDVAIKVANNYGQEWVFTLDNDELYYEFEYTGEEMTFGVDAYYVYGDPQIGDRWLDCAGASINYFSGSYWYKSPEGEYGDTRIIMEKGEYSIQYMTQNSSWNNRSVMLYISSQGVPSWPRPTESWLVSELA